MNQQRSPYLLWGLLILAIAIGGAWGQVLVASGTDDTQTHAWAVYENRNDEVLLVHLPPRDSDINAQIPIDSAQPGELHAVRNLNRFPDAIAAIENRIYLVFPTSSTPRGKIRRVFSGQAVPSPVGDLWGFIPTGRLDSEPAITAEGEVHGLVATNDTLWVLLKNEGRYTLFTMKKDAWDSVDLPPLKSSAGDVPARWMISAIGTQVIALDLSDPAAIKSYGFDDGQASWVPMDWVILAVPDGRFEILAGMRGLTAVDWDDQDQARIRAWSHAGLFTIAQGIDLPKGVELTVLDSVHRLLGLELLDRAVSKDDPSGEDRGVQVYEIDLSDGALVYAGDPIVSTPVSEAEMRFLMGMMILIMAGVLVVVIVPDKSDAMGIPDGFELADPGRRLMATMVDVFLISLGVGLIFDVRVIEIVTLGVIARSDDAWLAIPSVMVSGIVVMSIMEWLVGASPGKFFMGIRVVRAQGEAMQRIPLWAAIVRNVIKWVLPPVAALALVDPEMLHRGDRATRTIVAAPIVHAEDRGPWDSEDS